MPSFTPPTVAQGSDDHFWGRYSIQVGQSVVKMNGVFTLSPFPWAGDLEGLTEGEDYFLGGRTYAVTAEIAAELDMAGFGSEYIGYGEGAFSGGPYGG